jgi:3-hydroxybutyryl-CoA dehydratase
MITDYFESINVGDRHSSRARTITETDIVTFAMFSGDWHPAHTDITYADSDPVFGGRVAHGALVLSVALGLVTFRPEAMKAFYGIDRLRFVTPARVGDTLHVDTEVIGLSPRDAGSGVVTSGFTVLNQRGETVLAAELKTLVMRRPADTAGTTDRGRR